MRTVIYATVFAAAVTATGLAWWSTAERGAGQDVTGEAVPEEAVGDGQSCSGCAARHQRLTRPKDEAEAQ